MMNYETIIIENKNQIDYLTLNRPNHLNTITPQMCDELQDYFAQLQFQHETRVVILKGEGGSFCAGYDLKSAEGVSKGPIIGLRFQKQVSEVYARMRRCPQPIICLAHGATTGGGLAFALASDVRIIADDTKINVAMVKVGLTGCDVGISYFLPRSVGQSVAAELMMTGRFIQPQRALQLGLVSAVLPKEKLLDEGDAIAQDMLATSPMGLRLTKEGLNLSIDANSLEAAIAFEDRGQILCASAGLFEEGINAFLDKREAVYDDGQQ
jgi:enoyl-CoA hydratase/carnithine racemase